MAHKIITPECTNINSPITHHSPQSDLFSVAETLHKLADQACHATSRDGMIHIEIALTPAEADVLFSFDASLKDCEPTPIEDNLQPADTTRELIVTHLAKA